MGNRVYVKENSWFPLMPCFLALTEDHSHLFFMTYKPVSAILFVPTRVLDPLPISLLLCEPC